MTGVCKINIKMIKFSRKLILQNIAGTLIFIFIIGALIYFGFYLRVSQTDSQNKEITGIVREKWIDVSESDQGSSLRPKALIESEKGEKIVIRFDRETHDQIKIGTIIRRETNGDIKILQ